MSGMYLLIALALRIFAGFGLSVLLSICAIMLTWAMYYFMDYLWPRWVFIALWFSLPGVGAGLGAAIAWWESDEARLMRALRMGAGVLLGLAGAWAAYYYKTVIDPNPAVFSSREISETAILWSVIAPNLIASGIGAFRQIRTGWI